MSPHPQKTELDTVRDLIERGRFDEAYSLCVRLGEAGSTAAQLRLGWMYQAGKGVQKDVEKAESWYGRAIRPDSARAEFNLASIYWEKRDAKQMIQWLERSATKGYPPAMYELGRMYHAGYGVAVDTEKSLGYTEQAAQKGHLFARREIAREMLIGHRGWQRMPLGFLELLSVFWTGFRVARKDLYDDLTVTLRRHTKRDI